MCYFSALENQHGNVQFVEQGNCCTELVNSTIYKGESRIQEGSFADNISHGTPHSAQV
jgi:hypothetical protein